MKSPNARAEGRPGTHGPTSSGPNPLLALGSSRLTGYLGPGLKVPTMPPFSLSGREIIPGWEKNKVDCHSMRNSLSLMLLNFQYNFFLVIALDAIGPSGWIRRYRSNYKR